MKQKANAKTKSTWVDHMTRLQQAFTSNTSSTRETMKKISMAQLALSVVTAAVLVAEVHQPPLMRGFAVAEDAEHQSKSGLWRETPPILP
jgi:hypothetical protein